MTDQRRREVALQARGGTLTHCKRGHERTPENTDKRGSCRQCIRDLAEARRRAQGQRPIHERTTHCKRGHLRTPETTTGKGACTICKHITDIERRLALGHMLKVKVRAGQEVFCSKGHRLTVATISKYGVCAHCKHDYNVSHPSRETTFKLRGPVCKNGHVRTDENTYVSPSGSFACRVCSRASAKARRKTRRADPKGLSRRNEANRIRNEAKRRAAGIPERNWSARTLAKRRRVQRTDTYEVAPGPFLEWLDGWLARNPGQLSTLSARAGSAIRSVRSMREGEVEVIRLDLVDRYLLAAGEVPAVLNDLYPLADSHEHAVAA